MVPAAPSSTPRRLTGVPDCQWVSVARLIARAAPPTPTMVSAISQARGDRTAAASALARRPPKYMRGFSLRDLLQADRTNVPSRSVDVRAVVDRCLAVRLAGHQHEARAGLCLDDAQLGPGPKDGDLRRPCRESVAADQRLALEHVDEGVEVGRDRGREGSAPRQQDIQDEPRRPELD